MLFISSSKAQKKLVENVRERRLQMELTQEGLAERSGVPLSTLRKFEQKGSISLVTEEGEDLKASYHFFNNSYNSFVFIFPKGEKKSTKVKIILS